MKLLYMFLLMAYNCCLENPDVQIKLKLNNYIIYIRLEYFYIDTQKIVFEYQQEDNRLNQGEFEIDNYDDIQLFLDLKIKEITTNDEILLMKRLMEDL